MEKRKKSIRCLILINLLALSCIQQPKGLHHDLSDYLKNKHHHDLSSDVKNVLILTGNDCINCNKSYSNFISNNLANINFKNTLVIVTASSASIDLSAFPLNNSHIIFDKASRDEKYTFLNKSAYIQFGENEKVDTIVEINSDALENKLNFISEKMNETTSQKLQ